MGVDLGNLSQWAWSTEVEGQWWEKCLLVRVVGVTEVLGYCRVLLLLLLASSPEEAVVDEYSPDFLTAEEETMVSLGGQ